jgi:long-chain acyl-CoA synthetase
MGRILSGDRQLTTSDLEARILQVAAGLRKLGIESGDTLLLVLRNDFALIEASVAAGHVGAYPVPANWHCTPDELCYLIENTGTKVLIIHADLLARLRSAIPSALTVLVVPTPPEVQLAYPREQCEIECEGPASWHQWIATLPREHISPKTPPGTMIYTSGTTGRPKGVRRAQPTPGQAALTTRIWSRCFGFDRFACDSIVTIVLGPMYHSAPNSHGILAARLGGTVVLQPRFNAVELLALIEKHRVTHLHMVPIMFNRLLQLDPTVRRRFDLSSLRFVVHSAAPVSAKVKEEMLDWWGPVIHEYYGTSETSVLAFCGPEEWSSHRGTVGRPLADVDLRILADDGHPLPTGSTGRIGVRTPLRASFTYHRDEAKRASAMLGGYFITGDIGFMDADGFLFLRDRSTDMVISGGVNIYPAEIESELHRMAGVKDCAVFGIPDEEFGEALCAIVEPLDASVITAAEVEAFLRERLAGFKVPRYVEFRTNLPREDSGKIFKRKLREPYWTNVGRRI